MITTCKSKGFCSNCNETNSEALQFIYYLSTLLENKQCTTNVFNFTCSTIEFEISNASNMDEDLIEKCIRVRDKKCSAEWRIAENLFDIMLPDCSSFSENANFTVSRAPILDCPDNFGVSCDSLCLPLCGAFSLFNNTVIVIYIVLNILLFTISIVAGVITLIACYFHRDKMCVIDEWYLLHI